MQPFNIGPEVLFKTCVAMKFVDDDDDDDITSLVTSLASSVQTSRQRKSG